MTRRVPRRRDGADRALAATFRRNASGFHQGAEAVLTHHHEGAHYFLAIAIELALKAYLLDRGISDDWNRVYLRHDLVKTLRYARRSGQTPRTCRASEPLLQSPRHFSDAAGSYRVGLLVGGLHDGSRPDRRRYRGRKAAWFQRAGRSMMARLRPPWPLVVSQWWRWRYPSLWRGRTFDPHDTQQVMAYAVLRLRREARDVFLLNHIKALNYALIARHLGLTAADVQAWFAEALYEISHTVDLIERARPPSKLFKAEHPDV